MACIEDVYNRVIESDEEKRAFAEAARTPGGLVAFLAARGCDAGPEEVAAFLTARQAEQGEISDDELDAVAGGCSGLEATLSVLSIGVVCGSSFATISALAAQMSNGAGDGVFCDGSR